MKHALYILLAVFLLTLAGSDIYIRITEEEQEYHWRFPHILDTPWIDIHSKGDSSSRHSESRNAR